MIRENCLENARLEWDHALVAVRAVDALMEHQLWADAVSKASYAMFYMARCLLFSLGLEVRSHSETVHLLSLHFVRTGRLAPELVRSFSQMQQAREDADYQSALVFDELAAVDARTRLESFKSAVEQILGNEGFFG